MIRRRVGSLGAERNRDINRRRRKFAAQIVPIGAIEEEYVDDFARNRSEIDRYDRIEAGILNNAFQKALQNLLEQVLPPEDCRTHLAREDAAEDLARRYFVDEQVRAYVRELGLDDHAIDAEAFIISASNLDTLHRIKTSERDRSDKNLFMLSQTRLGQLACLQPSQEPAGEQSVPQLVAAPKRGAHNGD